MALLEGTDRTAERRMIAVLDLKRVGELVADLYLEALGIDEVAEEAAEEEASRGRGSSPPSSTQACLESSGLPNMAAPP
eukprot:5359512-Prymnesium_polylepis.1